MMLIYNYVRCILHTSVMHRYKKLLSLLLSLLLVFTDYRESQEIDPLLEIQKYAFILKLGLSHSYHATMLENLLQKLEEYPCIEEPILSVLQLLMQLKNSNVNPVLQTVKFKLSYL